ncbi:MAG: DAK2 domain-containing protein [Clostridia bacterium]|nr:DAK2 domain-containing protein [Clostridia bacterium]
MNTTTMNGTLFARMVRNGAANLHKNREIVNDLNVFPIPDGDTGDNMFMTMDSGSVAVRNVEDLTLEEMSSKVSGGMLLGARGNSGVILSRIFAGIAKGFRGNGEADVRDVAKAFECGVTESYGAVSVPVEGTILTVYRDAVRYAGSRIREDSTLEEYFEDFMTELRASLDRTPELLEVLKEAGVVDSGGAGFVYIAEGMKIALDGTDLESEAGEPAKAAPALDISSFTKDSVLEFGYCTEFLLRLQSSKTDVDAFDENELKAYLSSIGESVVAVKEDSIVKVHVHTMHPGEVLDHCQKFGEFLTMKIENMMLQHNAKIAQSSVEIKPRKPHKPYAIVTVASGEGIKETFASLGADVVIDGGQSMNPSAEAFIEAFESLDADTILVFPNNSNIILTAKQAASLYEGSDVRVIGNKTIGEGYAAISMLDTSSGDTDAILAEIDEIIASVVTGTVSKASRDTEKDGVAVHSGDYIGFVGDTIYVDSPNATEAALTLAKALHAENYDVMLLICGKDPEPADAEDLFTKLKQTYKRTEIIMIDGGQPVFDYLMILE